VHSPGTGARHRRVTHRLVPLGGLAFVAFIFGVVMGAGYVAPERKAADSFVRAWQKGDYRAMYDQLSDASRRRVSFDSFQSAYRDGAATATTRSLRFGSASGGGDSVSVPATAHTAAFGTINFTVNNDNINTVNGPASTVTVTSNCPGYDGTNGACALPQTQLGNLVQLSKVKGYYYASTKTIDLYYMYTNSTGTFRVLHDHLVKN